MLRILLGLVWALLVGCSPPSQQLPLQVEQTAAALRAGLGQVRADQAALVQQIEAVYAHLERYDLSLSALATAEGGGFVSFAGNRYYYKTEKTGASYYCSPGGPVTPELQRQIRIQQKFEAASLALAERDQSLVVQVFFGVHQPAPVVQLAPWVDVVSLLPPGLDLTSFEWYSRGLRNRPGQAQWSPAPFLSLFGGWVVDLAAPVYVDGEVRGVSVLAISLEKIKAAYLQSATTAYLLLGPQTSLLAVNPAAAALADWKVVAEVDYLRQMRENRFVGADYQLTDAGQTAEIQALGKALKAGALQASVQFRQQAYLAHAVPITEAGFTLVGLARQ